MSRDYAKFITSLVILAAIGRYVVLPAAVVGLLWLLFS